MKKFANILKDLRQEKGLSQTQISKKLKVSQSTVAKWESGDREPSISFLIQLADYFDVTVGYLVGTED